MHKSPPGILARILGWVLSGAVVGLAGWDAWTRDASFIAVLPDALVLGAGALVAAWIAARYRGVRLSVTFVLAAIVLLPAPAPMLVGLAACAGGLGAGVAGLDRRGGAAVFSILAPIAAAQLFYVSRATQPDLASTATLLELGVLFVVVQAMSTGLGTLLDVAGGRGWNTPQRRSRLLLEAVNAPLAWLLVSMTIASSPLRTLVFSGLIVVAQLGLRELQQSRTSLRQTHDSLSARVTELATLHAIGREILSSFDPSRVFAIVDRECRKILDLDSLFIAVVDRDTRRLEVAYRRESDLPAAGPTRPLGQGLASWAVLEKRAVRIDDLESESEIVPRAPELAGPDTRSVMAVPLIVEDEAIGVVCIHSDRPNAYDDHLLSVLTTIAQQAAVAIENARHYEMATVDSLTGLFLRPYFFRRLEEEYDRAKRYRGAFGLLMMDLDDFKAINDRYGHLVGDRYLRSFGAIVESKLRGPDLACRYGGDEVCLLLPETDLDGAKAIAERIRAAVGSLVVHVDSLAVRTTTSIGVAAFPDHHAEDLKSLLRKADEALYAAKNLGRDRVVPVNSAA